ncbi:CHAP domain-containing protein [Mycobacterium sp. M1]|uniref:CHAP domain-containing protein n=1 Tax=Mycolicibacter acidiphilus TaxID=2835306 RepID=A0ABS5RMK7_9MYCO|nr:CHAP domain-containing protein [Mycolicibacter acidiphilus]MBS9535546.1 CHAP domain-containing protein [Mycolicibacter acidiphilus]
MQSLLLAPQAHAEPTATVKAKTQRMSEPTLKSRQNGWYSVGDKLKLTCSTRGQSVQGHFSFNLPNGGWDDLWYRVSDGYYVADIDIETGTFNSVTPACNAKPAPAPAPAPPAASGRSMGKTTNRNTGVSGQCTWGAKQKWYQATGNRYYPDFGGNAKDWKGSARAAGWTVVDDAQNRAIVVFQPGVKGADPTNGHVAWVDSVSQRSDGRYIHVTEMNGANGPGNWASRDVKDVPGMSYILLP